jgi:hypothetical protein
MQCGDMDVKHGQGMDRQHWRAASICSLDMQLAHAAGMQHATSLQLQLAEVGNVTSKCNGVTRYCFCLAVKAITFRSNNS